MKAAAVSAFRSGLPRPCQWFPWPSSGRALKHLSDPAILRIPRSTSKGQCRSRLVIFCWVNMLKIYKPILPTKIANPFSWIDVRRKRKRSLVQRITPLPQSSTMRPMMSAPPTCRMSAADAGPNSCQTVLYIKYFGGRLFASLLWPFSWPWPDFLSRFKIQSPLLKSAASCHFRHRWSCNALFLFGHRSPSVAAKTAKAKGHPHLADQPTFSAKASPKMDPA